MSKEVDTISQFKDQAAIEIPSLGSLPAIRVELTHTREAEKRALEARTVNPATYTDLETCFTQAYRELKNNIATVSYHITKTENALEKAKAHALFDKYPEFMKNRSKSSDTADTRKAFLALDPEVQAIKERLDSLQALNLFLDGRVKVVEKISSYMKKSMDLIIRSGTAGLYLK